MEWTRQRLMPLQELFAVWNGPLEELLPRVWELHAYDQLHVLRLLFRSSLNRVSLADAQRIAAVFPHQQDRQAAYGQALKVAIDYGQDFEARAIVTERGKPLTSDELLYRSTAIQEQRQAQLDLLWAQSVTCELQTMEGLRENVRLASSRQQAAQTQIWSDIHRLALKLGLVEPLTEATRFLKWPLTELEFTTLRRGKVFFAAGVANLNAYERLTGSELGQPEWSKAVGAAIRQGSWKTADLISRGYLRCRLTETDLANLCRNSLALGQKGEEVIAQATAAEIEGHLGEADGNPGEALLLTLAALARRVEVLTSGHLRPIVRIVDRLNQRVVRGVCYYSLPDYLTGQPPDELLAADILLLLRQLTDWRPASTYQGLIACSLLAHHQNPERIRQRYEAAYLDILGLTPILDAARP